MNQLLEIRKNFLAITFFLLSFGASSQLYQSDLDSINSLIKGRNFMAAKSFALEAKLRNDEKAGSEWLTKSNLHLGYLYSKEDDFAKSIIHYLEGLRYSRDTHYEGIESDVTMLYYRSGLIFSEFRAYSLAEEYFNQGLEYARLHSLSSMESNLKYVLAGVFDDIGRSDEATELLLDAISNLEPESRMYHIFSNRLGLIYHESQQFQKSINIFNKLLKELPEDDLRRFGSYHHNLARSFRELKDYDDALKNYLIAQDYKQLSGNNNELFSTYYGLGETYYALNNYENSEKYFLKAEDLVETQPLHPDYFDIYKACADLSYTLQDYKKSKYYEDLFADKMDEYLKVQAEIQETDQRYNMELITKRYFAEVDKQERVATLLMYSKLTSGGLLILLFMVIGYHRYQKIRLRKSIERELIALKIIE